MFNNRCLVLLLVVVAIQLLEISAGCCCGGCCGGCGGCGGGCCGCGGGGGCCQPCCNCFPCCNPPLLIKLPPTPPKLCPVPCCGCCCCRPCGCCCPCGGGRRRRRDLSVRAPHKTFKGQKAACADCKACDASRQKRQVPVLEDMLGQPRAVSPKFVVPAAAASCSC